MTFMTIVTIIDNSNKDNPETCDIWDTDNNSDNWEPEIMTIFVIWQSIVTHFLQFLRCLLQYCIFFFIGMNFSFGWQCLSNSLYSFGAPKAFPGLLKRSSWPTSQKFIYFSWNLHLIIFMCLKFRFFLNSCCEIGWKSKSIANIFNIYEYIWSMHKINDKSWS